MGGGSSRNKTEPRGEGVKLAFDPDEKWSNLYREREKNHLYKWVGVRKGGELINIYERDGEEGVLKFAEEKLLTILYEEGQTPKLVTYSDYIKWKKGVNVQLGLSEESIDMQQSRFKEHYALWKLNKRGVEGENLIHLLLNREQQVCYEIARILLKRFPGMANDIYLGDEQFELPVKLPIIGSDAHLLNLIASSEITGKRVLVIYKNIAGKLNGSEPNFDIQFFMEKHKDNFDIWFRALHLKKNENSHTPVFVKCRFLGFLNISDPKSNTQSIQIGAQYYLLNGHVELCKSKIFEELPVKLPIIGSDAHLLNLIASSEITGERVLVIYKNIAGKLNGSEPNFDIQFFMEKHKDNYNLTIIY